MESNILVLADPTKGISKIISSSADPDVSTMRCGFAGISTVPFISVTVIVSPFCPVCEVSISPGCDSKLPDVSVVLEQATMLNNIAKQSNPLNIFFIVLSSLLDIHRLAQTNLCEY